MSTASYVPGPGDRWERRQPGQAGFDAGRLSEAVAYGVPDAKYGQLVGCALVPAGELAEEDVVAYCREHLAAFKVPSVVHIVDSIPRTPTGKVQRPRMPAHFGED